jgi:hypothetical protein
MEPVLEQRDLVEGQVYPGCDIACTNDGLERLKPGHRAADLTSTT